VACATATLAISAMAMSHNNWPPQYLVSNRATEAPAPDRPSILF
jgi:hypothetical protein